MREHTTPSQLRNIIDTVVRAVVLEDAKDKRNKFLGRAGGTQAGIKESSLCIRSLQSLGGTSQQSLEQEEEVVWLIRASPPPAGNTEKMVVEGGEEERWREIGSGSRI